MTHLRQWAAAIVATSAVALTPFSASAQDAASAKATFDGVNKHLDLGGQLYAFVNVQGDFASLAAKAQELYNQVLEMSDGNAPIPPGLDISKLLLELGLENVNALGASSIKYGKGYRNRAFMAIDGERKGLLRLTGGPTQPFKIGEFAPANAVMAMEMQVDLAALKDLVRSIGGQLEASMGMDPISGMLEQPVPGTQLNVSELVDALKGDVLLYASLDDTSMLQFPDFDTEFPGVDLVISHGNGRQAFEAIQSFLESNAPPEAIQTETVDGVTRLKIMLPDEARLGFFAPVIEMKDGSDQLLIASRPEAIKALEEGERLSSNAEFKALSEKLPKEGNGFSYVSKELYKVAELFVEAMKEQGAVEAEIQREMIDLVYGEPQTWATMWANLEDGVYTEGYAPLSFKLSIAYVAIIPAAVMGAVSVPMMSRIR